MKFLSLKRMKTCCASLMGHKVICKRQVAVYSVRINVERTRITGKGDL